MLKLTHRRRSAALAGVAATAALTLLPACGGGSGGDGKAAAKDTGVASITTPGKSTGNASASTSVDPDTGRPQLRLDTSDAESERLFYTFTLCLYHHGVPGGHKPGTDKISVDGDIKKYPDAYKACTSKWPLQPPELDPAKNPHYMDDYRAYIRCLNDGGLKVKALPDGGGWNYDGQPTMTDAQQHKLDRDCQLKAYK